MNRSQNRTGKSYSTLTPLSQKGRKRLGKFIVVDIESNDWKDFLLGGIYDGNRFETFTDAKSLCKRLDKFRDTKIFAHFGGIFDFLFLVNEWGLQNAFDSGLILRGSSIFSFRRKTNTYYDSSGILPFSLDKATKAFKVTHQKLGDIDHTQKKIVDEKLVKYLEHDCKGLYETIEKFYSAPILQDANFKPTLASQSIEVLRKYIKTPIPSIDSKWIDNFVRQGYAGGRVEIFRPYYESEAPLYYYDFTSLYPSVMRDMDVAGSKKKISKNITELSFVDCIVESPDEIYLPLLWRKTRDKFIFPKGKFRGVFPSNELIEAEKRGYKIHKVFKSIEFENLGPLFREYIDDLFHLKSNSENEVERQIAKLLLNAGYGRMGIKRERETLCIDDGSTGIIPTDIYIGETRLGRKENYYRGFSNPAIAAFITARARLKLYDVLEKYQDSIYYCDTDSIVTTSPIPDTGNGLGQLKLEGTANRACFLLPKTYIFGDQVKMKGFPKEFAQAKTFEDFSDAMEGELKAFKTEIAGKLARIKSTKNHGNILKVLNSSPRQLKAQYDKRILIKKGPNQWDSVPILIE